MKTRAVALAFLLCSVAGMGAAPQLPPHPNVIGLTLDSATKLLRRLDVGVVAQDTDVSDGVDRTVARQSPAANTPRMPGERADTIMLRRVVRRPPPLQHVRPSVRHLTFAAAAQLLRDSGVSKVVSTTKRTGTDMWIADQRPEAGTIVQPGAVDTLLMEARRVAPPPPPPPSHPPPPPRLRRPSVVDSTLEWAEGVLRKYGASRVVFVPTPSAKGQRVERQLPPAGTLMRPGEVDTLFLLRASPGGTPSWPWALAAAIGLAAVLQLTGALGPRVRVTLQCEPPRLTIPADARAITHDLTLKTELGDVTSELTTPTDNVILREERRHEPN